MSNYKPRVEMLRPQDLLLDPRVQRPLKEAHVKHIVENFDEEKLGVPQVTRRADGDYVTDGWHRTQALIRLGRGHERFACLVQTSTGLENEAKRFVAFNGERRLPNPIDLYKVKLEGRDPEAIAIQKILNHWDVKVGAAPGTGYTPSVSAITQVYRRYGKEALDQVIGVIHDAWNSEAGSYNSALISALGILLGEEDNDIDLTVLSLKLADDGTPHRIVGKGRTLASATSKSTKVATAEVILNIYNKGKRTNRVVRVL